MKILFVCTGNTCRSIMAEAILKSKSKLIQVDSAGIAAVENNNISQLTAQVLENEGLYDFSRKSKKVKEEMIKDSDIVLCFEEYQKNRLVSLFPEYKNKIYLLSEYVGECGDIPDPYGGTREAYESCFHLIKIYLKKLQYNLKIMNLREQITKIQDPYLRKLSSREVTLLDDLQKKWEKRIENIITKGWCFIENRRELYELIMKEAEEVQSQIVSVDFWVEKARDEGFPSRMLSILKHLLNRRDKEIQITKFFVMTRETFAKDKIKEILRHYRRELSTPEGKRAELAVILRGEFRETYPHLCRFLQHFYLFDENLVIVELSDQFGEATGTGPIIGKTVPENLPEEDKLQYGVLGNVERYVNLTNTLLELLRQREPSMVRVV